MLAFILLVVLGGGLGLLAVSLAESPKPATDRGSATRAARPTEDDVDDLDDDVETVFVPERSTAPAFTAGAPARRPPDPRAVPLAYTAIEGSFETVAVTPLWRRILSITTLVLIAVAIGIAIAVIAAAVMGAIAGFLDAAIG